MPESSESVILSWPCQNLILTFMVLHGSLYHKAGMMTEI